MTDDIQAALSKLNAKVLGRDGVTGTAIGQKAGAPCLKVYVSDAKSGGSVPSNVNGFPVVVETTGKFRRL